MAVVEKGIRKGLVVYASINSDANTVYFVDANNLTPSSSIGDDGDRIVDLASGETWLKSAGNYAKSGISSRVDAASSPPKLLSNIQYLTSTNVTGFSGLSQTLDGQSITLIDGDRVASIHASSLNIWIAHSGAWTAVSPALDTNNFFFVEQTLIDPVNERKLSIWQWSGTAFVKLGDFDFEVANTINLTAGYTPPASGAVTDVVASETVESAIGKLDTSIDNLLAVIGVLRTATNLGTFTNYGLSNQTLVQFLQGFIDRDRGEKSLSGVTAIQTLDTVAHATIKSVRWDVTAVLDSNSTKRIRTVIEAETDGVTVVHGEKNYKLNGNIAGLTYTVDISGTDVRLRVQATNATSFKSIRRVIA